MPNLGFSELLVILMIVVLVFGASRLPEIGEGMGRAIKNFKKGMASDESIQVKQVPPAAGAGAGTKPVAQPDDAEIVSKS